jgi:hypothetical protein
MCCSTISISRALTMPSWISAESGADVLAREGEL